MNTHSIQSLQKRVNDLHQTQVQAYREAAVKGLREWAQSEASLEPMEDHDTEDAFVERCVTAVVTSASWPNWRLDSAKMVVVIEIRKRARAVFAKYHPISTGVEESTTTTVVESTTKPVVDTNPTPNNNTTTTTTTTTNNNNNEDNDNNEDGDDDADDDGEVEDGEMDDDDQDEDGQVDENEATKSSDNGTKKKTMNAKNNKKKKVVVRKKATNIKQGQQGQPRKGGPTNRGRRPGRGGSNAGGGKSG